MRKRLLSILLAFTMVLALLPEKAAAAEISDYAEPLAEHLYYITNAGTAQETKTEILKEKTEPISLSTGYVFEAVFSHPENIDRVFITSTINGQTSYLETTAIDTDRTAYRTWDCFNNDESYIPGAIGIEYTKKAEVIPVSESWDSAWDNFGIRGASVENISSGEPEENTVTCAISNLLEGISGPVIEASISHFEDNTGISGGVDQLKDWLGYYEDLDRLVHYELSGTQSDHDYIMYLGYPAAENQNYAMIIRDVTGNRYTKILIKALTGNTEEVANRIALVNKASKLLYNYYQISGERVALQEQIDASTTMTAEQKAVATQKNINLDKDRKLFAIMTTVLPLMAGAAGGGAPALLFSALLGGITSTSNLFWEHRIGMIQGCEPIDGVFSDNGSQEGCGIPLTRENVEIIYSDDWQGWDRTADAVIRESGKYYVTGESLDVISIYVGYPDNSGPALDVTICLHGKYLWNSIHIRSGSTLHLCDCKYEEHDDGSSSGGEAGSVITVQENSKLIVDSIISNLPSAPHAIRNNGGEVIINGGTIGGDLTCGVYSENGGKVTLNGGTIVHGICSKDDGEVVINGGAVTGYADVHRIGDGSSGWVGVWTDNGRITMNNGKITSMTSENGEVTINNGQIGNISSSCMTGLKNGSGTVTVKGGEIEGFREGIRNDNGTITISGGTINGLRNGEGGKIAINKGTVLKKTWNDNGTITISGGTISGLRNEEGGKIIINKGAVLNGIENKGNSNITISGGTIQGYVENKNEGKIVISGGVFKSDSWSICNCGIGSVIFFINKNSMIEVNSKTAALFNMSGTTKIPLIEVDTDYSGGVTYFHAPDSEGVKMTIQEAANIDYTQSYVCLMADGVTDRPGSGEEPGECEHSYTSVVATPTCTERGYTTHTCGKCGHSYRDNYVNALGHSFGKWVVIREATSTTAGSRERICAVCNYKETSSIPATGGSSGNSGSSGGGSSSSSGNSSSSGGGSSGSGSGSGWMGGASSGHQISSAKKITGGTVNLSKTNATAGQTVTVTVLPDSGYELDTLKILDSSRRELRLSEKAGKYTFTMPNSKVSVIATFRPIGQGSTDAQAPNTGFSDVPNGYWAESAINWARSNGYMNGITGSVFNPEGTITRQQLCMILARLSDQSPSSMAEARIWAMNNGLSDGTNTGAPITRQQMVTFLYRYCGMVNYPIVGSGSLTAFPDCGSISNYAKEPLAWAVGSGIVTGTKTGMLNPTGTATRAQFAVVLQRFYNHVISN